MALEALSSKDSPFREFLHHAHGLRSFQPTLLWKVVFSRYGTGDNIMFTDSITVPGEKVSTAMLETFVGDIPYPINERRTTSNMLSIGLFVDIYAFLETQIVNDIKEVAKSGIKTHQSEFKQTITLNGYRMNGTLPSPTSEDFVRDCYIQYQFFNCIPVSMDEYNYDHKNDKWARTRNVSFAFTDYKIITEAKELKDTKTYEDEKLYIAPTPFNSPNKNLKANSYVFPKRDDVKSKADSSQDAYVFKHVNLIRGADWDNPGTGRDPTESPSFSIDTEKNPLVKTETKAAGDRLLLNGTLNTMYTYTKLADNNRIFTSLPVDANFPTPPLVGSFKGKQGPTTAGLQSIDAQEGRGLIPTGPTWAWKLNPVGNKDADTVNGKYGEYSRNSLVGDIVRTAIKKYLIPDAPIYHGLLSPVSKAIRKVEQWFYTEPKHKTTPADDVPLVNTHVPADRVGVDPDDTPRPNIYDPYNTVEVPYYDHIVNHGPADTIKVPQEDFTRQNNHGEADTIKVDPDDHTHQDAHGDPNDVKIDPNDYTRQGAHGDPNDVKIDPNDHTKLGAHDDGNQVPVDPNDHTKLGAHGSPNNIPIDQNDHTRQGAHGDANLVPVDPNDHPTQTNVKGNQILIDPNDYVRTTTLSPNVIPVDPMDHIIDSSNIKADEKMINPNDYVIGTGVVANTVPIDPEDYARSDSVKPNNVKIDPNDHIINQDDIDFNHVKINENDYADSEEVLKGKAKLVEISQNDRTDLFNHEKADLKPIDQHDAIHDHRKTSGLVPIDQNDKIMKHKKDQNRVSIDQNDTPNVSELKPKHVPVPQSFIDFARIIINEKKVDGDNIKQHNEHVDLKKVGDDKLTTHSESAINIVERPKEPQAIVSSRRDTGHLVDVHADDHTEMK